ncbi:hypothetical protein [Devosia psychrophila]|uniref:Uncharacterized protein n=1 Tax=Devosia psychrophila TaxID=728005 RepID=A0A1I1P1K1_9HYPH|nr:hypothetical protein [Devosia psychrophila]SFD00833.1 hypothetical protein SAMN04488059_11749 [Devosia psychrophila]
MPVFYRNIPTANQDNTIAVRIFCLPEGLSCVVSWPLPEPGLRIFSPTAKSPQGVDEALPYAKFLSDHLCAGRVAVELDEDVEWDPRWGELVDLQ